MKDHHQVIARHRDAAFSSCGNALSKKLHQQGIAGIFIRCRPITHHRLTQLYRTLPFRWIDQAARQIEGDRILRDLLVIVRYGLQLGVKIGHTMRRPVHQEAIARH
ncbi:hypothetical protein ES703_101042 [subsurface metagenome]